MKKKVLFGTVVVLLFFILMMQANVVKGTDLAYLGENLSENATTKDFKISSYGSLNGEIQYGVTGKINDEDFSLFIKATDYNLPSNLNEYKYYIRLRITYSEVDYEIFDCKVINFKTSEIIENLSEENIIKLSNSVVEKNWIDTIKLSEIKENEIYKYTANSTTQVPRIENDIGKNCIFYIEEKSDHNYEKINMYKKISSSDIDLTYNEYTNGDTFIIMYRDLENDELLKLIEKDKIIYLSNYKDRDELEYEFEKYIYNDTEKNIVIHTKDTAFGIEYSNSTTIGKGKIYEFDWTIDSAIINYTTLDGDINRDTIIDTKDLTYLGRYLNGIQGYTVTKEKADVNEDGVIDWNDYNVLKKHLAGEIGYEDLPKAYPCGDTNRDYIVNTNDIGYLGKCLNGTYTAVIKVSDVNEDGEVDWKDYSILKKHIARETGYITLPKVYACGDINRDYLVDASDIAYLGKNLNGNTNYPIVTKLTDLNGDGEIDWKDYSILKKYVAGETGYITLPKIYACGDINRDYLVDASDIAYLGRNLNGNTNYPVITKTADVNGDGEVDWKDYSILKKHITGETGYELLPKVYACGDVNRDYLVNGSDVTYLGKYLNGVNGYPVIKLLADINFDGQVDWADYKELKSIINNIGN